MCGISGIINKCGPAPQLAEIQSITDLIAHRGPDGHGYFIDGNIAFGHRRLAILDISPAGHQPMHYLERYVVTFNGEIYNYIELRQELGTHGFKFTSNTDTEVILAAYDKWGADCVTHFNGMWAFAIYDRRAQTIFCSRDRFGVKPLYYSDSPDRFVFGSEIKQILAARNCAAIANMQMLRDFLVEGFHDHTNATFFDGVFNLRPGHNIIYSIKDNSFSEVEYYSLKRCPDLTKMGEASATTKLLEEFKRSINYQLRSDVAVGVCLSGGLDSSCIAAVAARLYHQSAADKLQAVHAKSSEQAHDESAYAREISQDAGIALSIIEPTTADFIDALDEVVYFQEEPFAAPSICMQYFVYEKAKQMGCKVMLDGQGSDEVLLGYERYYSAYLRSASTLNWFVQFFQMKHNSRLSLSAILANFIYFTIPQVRIKNLQRKAFFLKPEYTRDFPNIINIANVKNDIRTMQLMEIEALQLPHLLRYADKNSMRHSIEARVPFLDHQLIETCVGINNRFKIKNGWTKYALRVALKGLVPRNILWRKIKLGFEAPVSSWMEAMQNTIETTIQASSLIKTMCRDGVNLKDIDRATLWKLFSIAKWETAYAVRLRADGDNIADIEKHRPLEAA